MARAFINSRSPTSLVMLVAIIPDPTIANANNAVPRNSILIAL